VAVRYRAGRRCGVTSGDRGSASVWLLCAGLVVLSFGLTGALAAAAATGRHRAQAAADLGALAGARYAVDGEPTACARAAAIVAANGARVAGCRLDGLDLVVTAEVPVAGVGTARGVARAGPVGEAAGHSAVREPGGCRCIWMRRAEHPAFAGG
jgi:secretion/DNA translocation related TadE-like protein